MSAEEIAYFEKEFPYDPEYAQNPHLLVGKRVVVGGLGKGLVLEFHKVFSFFADSNHTIDFKADIGLRKVLLRRKKNLKFNSGLYFRVMTQEEARIEKENEGKAEITALKDQLAAVETALRSTVSKHETEISQLQEDHEKELVTTELRLSSMFNHNYSPDINTMINKPSLVAEGDEEDEDSPLARAIKAATVSAELAEKAEYQEAQARSKVTELEEKIEQWKEKLERSVQERSFVSPYERMASDSEMSDHESAQKQSLVDTKQDTFIQEMVSNLEEQLDHAIKKVETESEARELAVYEADQAALLVPRNELHVPLDPFEEVVVNTMSNTVNTLEQMANLAANETTDSFTKAGETTEKMVVGMADVLARGIGLNGEASDGDDDEDVFQGQSGLARNNTGDQADQSLGATEAMLRREHAELQAAAARQHAEVKRLETLAQNEDVMLEKHEVVVNKMEAMATQLATVESELRVSIAEKEFLLKELNAKQPSSFRSRTQTKPLSDDEGEDDDDDEFAAANAALAEAEAASEAAEASKAKEETEALRKEIAELRTAALAASAASSALRFELKDGQATLTQRKHDSAHKTSLSSSPSSIIDDDAKDEVKQSLDDKFKLDEDKKSLPLKAKVDVEVNVEADVEVNKTVEVMKVESEDESISQLSEENEKLRQQLRDLEARNERLLHDTEAVTSVVEHASDYERMIAATEKFHQDVVNIRGFSVSIGRGESHSMTRSEMDEREPSFLADPEVREFERFSMATNAFHGVDGLSRDETPSPGRDEQRDYQHLKSPPTADGQPARKSILKKVSDVVLAPNTEETPRVRSFPFVHTPTEGEEENNPRRNFPSDHDEEDSIRELWPREDFREQSLHRVAALNKDASALEEGKKLVDAVEAELNDAIRNMSERGDTDSSDETNEEVSKLAAKLAEARRNYQESEEKLHRDVEELKKSVEVATADESEQSPQVNQLKRATLQFQQSMEPLRDRSLTRQQESLGRPSGSTGVSSAVKATRRPSAVRSNKKAAPPSEAAAPAADLTFM